jgi:cyanophycinase
MLFAIGGGLDCQGDRDILKRILQEAKGAGSSVCIITTATNFPDEARRQYLDAFGSLGATDCRVLHLTARSETEDPHMIRVIQEADIVFFTGGDQLKLSKVFAGTPLMKAITEGLEGNSLIVAGTSAGAAALSREMIYPSKENEVCLLEGFGLTEELVVDTHFSERNRLSRLFNAVAQGNNLTGLGVDENTAAIIKPDGTLEVIGAGTATIIAPFKNASARAKKTQPAVLNPGDKYNLKERKRLP